MKVSCLLVSGILQQRRTECSSPSCDKGVPVRLIRSSGGKVPFLEINERAKNNYTLDGGIKRGVVIFAS